MKKNDTGRRRLTSSKRGAIFVSTSCEERHNKPFWLAINLASQQKTTKLYFSSQVRKKFKLLAVPFKTLRFCLRNDKFVNCHVWKFCKDQYFQTYAWFDLSIKSYFLMVSSLILLRSLRVYILKQLFFSISVNSGFGIIYPAAFAAR